MIKSVLFLLLVVLNFENIVSKSFQLHDNDLLDDELEAEERLTPKAASEDGVIWKRIDMNPREGSLTNKEESNSGNDFLTQQPTSPQMVNEDTVEKEMPSENENEITFKKQPLSDNSVTEVLDGQNFIAKDSGLDQLSATSLSVELEPHNLTTAIVIDFSNITGEAIVLDTFIENVSPEDDLDEVSEMSKGEPIAFLHEMPTSSFEFLIDSQTKRNILLKELLGSQSILSVEEGDTETSTLRELEHPLSAIDLHSRGNNFEELMLNDKSAPVSDKSEVDEMAGEENLNEITTFAEIEVKNSSENIVPECPPPGWCIFWFLSQDTCAVNSHCLGSRICCKTGCSKTCVDV